MASRRDQEEPCEAWLGEHGLIAVDGGVSDHGELLLNPIADAPAIPKSYTTIFAILLLASLWRRPLGAGRTTSAFCSESCTFPTSLLTSSYISLSFCTISAPGAEWRPDAFRDGGSDAVSEYGMRNWCPKRLRGCIRSAEFGIQRFSAFRIPKVSVGSPKVPTSESCGTRSAERRQSARRVRIRGDSEFL